MPVTIARKNCILYKKEKRRHDANSSIDIRKKSPTAKGYMTIVLPPCSKALHGFSVNNGALEFAAGLRTLLVRKVTKLHSKLAIIECFLFSVKQIQ